MENLKKSFRKIARQNLLSLDKNDERYRDKSIAWCLKDEILRRRAKNILLYLPLGLEVDMFGLIKSLRKMQKIHIFVPFVVNNTFKIVPFRLPLRKNKYNIFETYNSTFVNFNKIDIAIVPVLGVDIDYKRIGFGKGMYDRFYSSLDKKPFTIFVSRILHFSNTRITDRFDIMGDMIITHKRGNYEFINDTWICRRDWNFNRPYILYNQKTLSLKAKYHHRTGKNQSHCY